MDARFGAYRLTLSLNALPALCPPIIEKSAFSVRIASTLPADIISYWKKAQNPAFILHSKTAENAH